MPAHDHPQNIFGNRLFCFASHIIEVSKRTLSCFEALVSQATIRINAAKQHQQELKCSLYLSGRQWGALIILEKFSNICYSQCHISLLQYDDFNDTKPEVFCNNLLGLFLCNRYF